MLLLCICFARFRSLPYGETQILLLLMREAEAIKSMSYERSRTESEDETLAKGRCGGCAGREHNTPNQSLGSLTY